MLTQLEQLRAFLRARLIPFSTALRLWSLWLIGLAVIWQSLPAELLATIPAAIAQRIDVAILFLAGLARVIQQDLPEAPSDGR